MYYYIVRNILRIVYCTISVSTLTFIPFNDIKANTLEQGYQAYIKTDFTGARDKLIIAAQQEKNPVKLIKIYKLMGIVYYMLSNLNESAKAFNFALSYNPGIMITKGEVLDESVITFFNRIKAMRVSSQIPNESQADTGQSKKNKKKRYRIVKKRRPLTTREKIYAFLPFGSGQFMHRQYFYGALSGTLQLSAFSYFFYINNKIDNSKSREKAAMATNLEDDVKAIIAAEGSAYRKKQKTYQQLAIGGFLGLWAISSLDALLTPEYTITKRIVLPQQGSSRSDFPGHSYVLNLDLAPKSYPDSWDILIKVETQF